MNRILTLMAICLPLMAAAPPEVGQKAPDFTRSTVEGKSIRLSQETAKGKVVLVVLRGFPGYQCPFCNRQVQDFLKSAKAFADAGARVLMVYPGPPQDLNVKADEFLQGKTLPGNFNLVLDPAYEFTNLYGLRWDAPKETAYPSTFVVDRQGAVRYSKISKEHGGRTTAAEVLEALRAARWSAFLIRFRREARERAVDTRRALLSARRRT